MAVTAARGLASTDIRCPECRSVRTVSARQASRWRKGEYEGICNQCRRGHYGRQARDSDIAWWLNRFGVQVPRGVRARDYLTASGVPPDVAAFAKDCYPLD